MRYTIIISNLIAAKTFEEASKIFSKLEEIRVELQQTTNNMLSTFGIDEKRTTGVCEAIVGFIWSVAANYAKQEKSELFSCRIERLPPYFHITFEEVDRDRRELYVFKENLFKYIDIITEKEQTVSVLLGQLEELMYKMTGKITIEGGANSCVRNFAACESSHD